VNGRVKESGEGYVSVPGGRVWYRVMGHGGGTPLLVLHGGPGMPHDYLKPLGSSSDTRFVVFYDQLGCGRADRPTDPGMWRIDHFLEELSVVRGALGLDVVHLFGHSWGSMLAVDHCLAGAAGVESLILASPPLSMSRWIDDTSRYRRELPAEVQETLSRCERAGQTDSPEYHAAVLAYERRHVCRLDPWPDALHQALAQMNDEVYETMWGANEFTVTGNLKEYDRTSRLHEVTAPTLFTCGRYDEATPATVATYQERVKGAEAAVFQHSSHMAHLEEETAYLHVVRNFLQKVEGAATSSSP
jgi:proline-specific peptidase